MKPLAGGALGNATLAFKYLMQFPDVVPIPGIEKIHEIEEIVDIVNGPMEMTEAEKQEMQRLRDELGKRFCRRCDYCQPCSEGISISYVLQTDTLMKRLPPESVFSGRWADVLGKASDCIECGDCESRCPYQLPIRDMIKEFSAVYQEAKKQYQEGAASR
jgi:predicted aldo/keto reductase-like oxidoreductase